MTDLMEVRVSDMIPTDVSRIILLATTGRSESNGIRVKVAEGPALTPGDGRRLAGALWAVAGRLRELSDGEGHGIVPPVLWVERWDPKRDGEGHVMLGFDADDPVEPYGADLLPKEQALGLGVLVKELADASACDTDMAERLAATVVGMEAVDR